MAQKVNRPERGPTEKVTIRDILNELLERTSSNMKRLRVLEQSVENLTNRINSIENGMFEHRKELAGSISDIEDRLSKSDDRLAKLEMGIKEIVAQLKRVATIAKVKELEQLIEIYNPIRSQFVTREEVERLIEEKIK